MRIASRALTAFAALGLASCGIGADDAVVDVAFIGSTDDLFATDLRLGASGQHLRAATAEGLVALDSAGNVVPAVAERWIVTDDGLSYIFRLRNSEWADGSPLTSQTVRDSMQRTIGQLRGTSLGLDLAKIDEIRAMTGRVVEIRLQSPMPQLLQVLAQPELGLRRNGAGMGPMGVRRDEDVALLTPLSLDKRGLPQEQGWENRIRQLRIRSTEAGAAVEAFESGQADLLLNGTVANLPLADTGALTRGTVRLDAALGLFGLQIRRDKGVLADAGRREAISMAIDRETLLQPFNIGGWIATTRIVPPGLPDDIGTLDERWSDLDIEQRREIAADRITAWRGRTGSATVFIYLPPGPGSDILFRQLDDDVATIGITLVRADSEQDADMVLVDRVARYGSARWFLNQFNCRLDRGLCSEDADARVAEAAMSLDPLEHAALLAEAEAELAAGNGYIPIGAPIRWSLARGGVDGFEENRWNLHPLFPLALRPI